MFLLHLFSRTFHLHVRDVTGRCEVKANSLVMVEVIKDWITGMEEVKLIKI